METTDLQPDREWIAVPDVLNSLIPKFAALHPSIQFTQEGGSPSDNPQVFADQAGLQRILNNLLDNAARFARNRVMVTVTRRDQSVRIDVDDDGRGIPESERGRVLEPFIRLQTSENDHGVGLGLALVQRILAQHEGHVDVLSNPWGGCRIRTIWPNPDSSFVSSNKP